MQVGNARGFHLGDSDFARWCEAAASLQSTPLQPLLATEEVASAIAAEEKTEISERSTDYGCVDWFLYDPLPNPDLPCPLAPGEVRHDDPSGESDARGVDGAVESW